MSLQSNLQKRDTGYYFRVSVPISLRPVIGKSEIIKSLKTKDARQAKLRCQEVSLHILKWFDALFDDNYKKESHVMVHDTMPCVKTFMPVLQATIPVASSAMKLSELLDKWKLHTGYDDTDNTYQETARPVKEWIFLHGDSLIASMTSEEVAALRNYYLQHGELKRKTINKYMGCIKKLRTYAIDNGYIRENLIADGCYKVASLRGEESNRRPFTLEELHKLFTSPYFTGYDSPKKKHIAGSLKADDAFYWLPLIALYTGMRMNEIAQLATDDIKQEGGIWYIHATDEESFQKLKTTSSKRKVPIHRELINFGLLKYHQRRIDNREERLFTIICNRRDGRISAALSQSFSRYTDKIGISDPNAVFHSFRHGIKDVMRNAEVPREIHDAITGHKDGSVSGGYGLGFALPVLHKAIESISYGIDLSHLYRINEPILMSPYANGDSRLATNQPTDITRKNWTLLKDAFIKTGRSYYGDALQLEEIKRLVHEHKNPIRNGLLDAENTRYLSNHPLYPDAHSYSAIPPASETVCSQAQYIRQALLKSIHNECQVKLIDSEGEEHIDRAIRYLQPSDRFKVYYMDSLIDVMEGEERITYQVFIEAGDFEEWLGNRGRTWGME